MPIKRTAPQPYHTPASGSSYFHPDWQQYWAEQRDRVEHATHLLASLRLQAQGAAIAVTAFDMPVLEAGLYKVTYFARITRAASTSSQLNVNVVFTDGAIVCTMDGAAIAGNTTATVESESFLVRIDRATTIRYSTTYASVGATTMQYGVDFVVESVPVN